MEFLLSLSGLFFFSFLFFLEREREMNMPPYSRSSNFSEMISIFHQVLDGSPFGVEALK